MSNCFTCTIIGRCITFFVDTYISTWVTFTGTITTTKDCIDNVRTYYRDICGRNSSSITTAIYEIYTGFITTFDNYFCCSSSNFGSISWVISFGFGVCC